MKKCYISTLYLILLSAPLLSQSWGINTTWVYESDEFGPPIDKNYLVHKITKDTLIEDKVFYKIDYYYRPFSNGPFMLIPENAIYLHYRDQKMLIFDKKDTTIHLIYDFSLNKGDSYMAYCDITQQYINVKIDSTDTMMLNNASLKVQYVSTEWGTGCYLNGKIIEGIGAEEYLLPRYTFVDPPPGGYLICYQDINTSYPDNSSCDLLLNTQNPDLSKNVVYPNPANNYIQLKNNDFDNPEIFNATGQKYNVRRQGTTLAIEHLPVGTYFIKYSTSNGSEIQKFIILRP